MTKETTPAPQNEESAKREINKLPIFIILSIFLALISTIIGLLIYKLSGDIYIDRSRPGYISDQEKNENDGADDAYSFSSDGEVSRKDLDEFYVHMSEAVGDIKANAFSPDDLSDEALGIAPPATEDSNPAEDY
jgi:hypothetical protein